MAEWDSLDQSYQKLTAGEIMKVIKAAVIGMGILIVLGLGLLVYGVSTRLGNISASPSDTIPANGVPFDSKLQLEKGQRVLGTTVDDGRLIVETGFDNGVRVFLIFDSGTGRGLGRITLGADAEQ